MRTRADRRAFERRAKRKKHAARFKKPRGGGSSKRLLLDVTTATVDDQAWLDHPTGHFEEDPDDRY